MSREDWPDNAAGGYEKDGVAYCCQACVEGPGCTCKQYQSEGAEHAPTQEEIRGDQASGDLVQSLQHQTETIAPADYGTEVTDKKPAPPSHD